MVTEGSAFHARSESWGTYEYAFVISCGAIAVGMYAIAAKIQHVLLAKAEQKGSVRWRCGGAGWVVGLVLLYWCSYLTTGGG